MCSCSIEKDLVMFNLYAISLRHLHFFRFDALTVGGDELGETSRR